MVQSGSLGASRSNGMIGRQAGGIRQYNNGQPAYTLGGDDVSSQQNDYTASITNFLQQQINYGLGLAPGVSQGIQAGLNRDVNPTQGQQLGSAYRANMSQIAGSADPMGSSAAAMQNVAGQQYNANMANARYQNREQALGQTNAFMGALSQATSAYPYADMAPGTSAEGANAFNEAMGINNYGLKRSDFGDANTYQIAVNRARIKNQQMKA